MNLPVCVLVQYFSMEIKLLLTDVINTMNGNGLFIIFIKALYTTVQIL